MSMFKEQKTNIKDTDCLIKALEEEGYHPEYHEKGDNLIGYHGDKRSDKAEVIIRRKEIGSVSNDIGFKRASDGTYQAIISEYDSSRHDTKWLNNIQQKYAVHKIKKIAKIQGLELASTPVHKNGKVIMQYKKV